jgi:chorismate mutase/prephenate dehydratase
MMLSQKPKVELEALRSEIDAVDRTLVQLLNDRARLAIQIGQVKRHLDPSARNGKSIYSPKREQLIFDKLKELNQGPLPQANLNHIFREILSSSVALQHKDPVQVAFLGPWGTHSHQVAKERFGSSIQYIPAPTISGT